MFRSSCVLPAVDFDDQSVLLTYEIDDERSDWRLPPKAQAGETMPTEHEPQEALGIRRLFAQSLRALAMKL
jgi:hypothetical protein